jgi:hypothetical protein
MRKVGRFITALIFACLPFFVFASEKTRAVCPGKGVAVYYTIHKDWAENPVYCVEKKIKFYKKIDLLPVKDREFVRVYCKNR